MTQSDEERGQRHLLRKAVGELDKADVLLDRVVIRFNGPLEASYRGYPVGGGEHLEGFLRMDSRPGPR